MKKAVFGFFALVMIFGSISVVSAWSLSKNFSDFEKDSSTSIDSNNHKMNTSFVTDFIAESISGSKSPIIRNSVQTKSIIGWTKAAIKDLTIESANKTYQAFWTSEKTYRVKSTWKQTNGYANIPSGSVKLWD